MQLFQISNMSIIFINLRRDYLYSTYKLFEPKNKIARSYKIHIIPYTPDGIVEIDEVLTLQNILMILAEKGGKGQQYIHISKKLNQIILNMNIRRYPMQNFIIDKSVKKYRFGDFNFVKNRDTWERHIIIEENNK